jgi:DNA uptake protein ComE-like DNA-binding protein
MRPLLALAALTLAVTLGCNNSPTPDQIRHDTAAATATVAADVKGAAEGVRDGLHNSRGGPGYDTVNINTANRLTLMTLPGLTAAQSGQIIAHRPYRTPADLQRRRIIPADEYDKIAPRITTSTPN